MKIKDRCTDHWNRIQNSEISPPIYGKLVFTKCQGHSMRGAESLFNKWCWYHWITTGKRRKWNLTPYTKINSKWIKDLNVKAKTIKLLEENIKANLHDTEFLNNTPKLQATEEKNG